MNEYALRLFERQPTLEQHRAMAKTLLFWEYRYSCPLWGHKKGILMNAFKAYLQLRGVINTKIYLQCPQKTGTYGSPCDRWQCFHIKLYSSGARFDLLHSTKPWIAVIASSRVSFWWFIFGENWALSIVQLNPFCQWLQNNWAGFWKELVDYYKINNVTSFFTTIQVD